jgi:hypothetical protein
MMVPLFVITHSYAFLGMFLFSGYLQSDTDYGDGPGKDPNYGLLCFSSYLNSMVIMMNLLVVNSWVKMGFGLSNAVSSLWPYLYFMSFFLLAVGFCLVSLTQVFIGSIIIDQNSNPHTKSAAMDHSYIFPAPDNDIRFSQYKTSSCLGQTSYKLSKRHQDADKLFSIIDTVSVRIYHIFQICESK